MIFSDVEGAGDSFYNPQTGRDEYQATDINVLTPYAEAGLIGELGVKLNNGVFILLNYHFIEANVSTLHYGFNLAKTGIVIRF